MMKKLVERFGKQNSDIDELRFFHYVTLGFQVFCELMNCFLQN